MPIAWPRFAEIVRAHQRFLLVSHIRPDCDALGSELGMAGVLEALGKSVRIVNGQAMPPNLAFIDPQRRIGVIGQTVQPAELANVEVLIVLDTSAWAQLGPMADFIRSFPGRKLVVDHHVSEDDLGAETFKDTQAEATGRLVVEAAEALGATLTPEIATPLFAAVATDTGWFRFASASAGTYRCAAKLIDAGACPAAIYNALYEQDTLGRMKLRGVILSRIETELNGRLAHTYVLREDFAQTGSLPSDTEDVINLALAIGGTQFAVILVEQQSGGFKISFRSRCGVDCSKLAEEYGGGGHKAAAGAFLQGSLAEVQPRVLDAVRAAMQ
jgi:phosphoesterase RecJ-like protein